MVCGSPGNHPGERCAANVLSGRLDIRGRRVRLDRRVVVGFLEGRRRRREARDEKVRAAAYDKAVSEGASPEDANTVADEAVQRARRRRRLLLISAGGGAH